MKSWQLSARLTPQLQDKLTISTKNLQKQIQTLNIQKLQKYVLSVQNSLLKKQLQIYQWRQKTDFPIIKINSYKILEQKFDKTLIQIILNSSSIRINTLKDRSLQQIIFLLKQAFVGFQRLYSKFKTFNVDSQMIVIDCKGKCRVWINRNLALNQVEGEQIEFEQYYRQIISIFEEKTLKNPTSMSFYLGLKSVNCFIKGLRYIQDFLKLRNIKPIPYNNNKAYSNTNRQQIKKIASTPNLFLASNKIQFLSPSNQQQKCLRQTIGYSSKRNNNFDTGSSSKKQFNNALTFNYKSTKPSQNRIIKMIQQHQEKEKREQFAGKLENRKDLSSNKKRLTQPQPGTNSLTFLERFKHTTRQRQAKNQSVKQIPFLTTHRVENIIKQKPLQNPNLQSQHLNKRMNVNKQQLKLKFMPYQRYTKPLANQVQSPQFKAIQSASTRITRQQQKSRMSVNQTRSTQFFNISNQKFFNNNHHNGQNQNAHYCKKFGEGKISQIATKKISQTSQLSRDVESILDGINDYKINEMEKSSHEKGSKSADLCSIRNIITNAPILNSNIDNNPVTKIIVGNNDPYFSSTLTDAKNNNPPQTYSSSSKYGQICDQFQQPTALQIQNIYQQRGWKTTLQNLILPEDDQCGHQQRFQDQAQVNRSNQNNYSHQSSNKIKQLKRSIYQENEGQERKDQVLEMVKKPLQQQKKKGKLEILMLNKLSPQRKNKLLVESMMEV